MWLLGKILTSPQGVRDIRREDVASCLLYGFHGTEEPRFVFADRHAEGSPIVVAGKLGRVLAGNIRRIERVVAEKEEGIPMDFVGATLGDHVHNATRTATELGLVASVNDLKLSDGVLGEGLEYAAMEVVVVLQPINQK